MGWGGGALRLHGSWMSAERGSSRIKGKFKSSTCSSFSPWRPPTPPPLSAGWFKYQLNSVNAPIKARDKSCVMYAPSCGSLIFATHTSSPLALGAIFIWGIKNPLSPDPIDIWVSISEIITTSGQNPATFFLLWVWRCSHPVWPEGSSLVPGSVCVLWVCESVLVWCVHSCTDRVCRDGSVAVWKSDFVPFVSRRAAPLVLLGWKYEESQWEEKGAALFKAGFTHSSVPIWDTVPGLSPQSTFD